MMNYFEHYQRVNDLSESGRRSHWRPFEKTLGQYLPEHKASTIVDVGCGAGILLEWLGSKGYKNARGIDPDVGQIAFCQQLGVAAEQAIDSAKWLGERRDLDLIICKDILEHIPETSVRSLLVAARKSLAIDGTIYISVPNALSPLAPFWLYNDPTHLRSYSERVIGLELLQAGFEVVAVGDDDTWVIGGLAGIVRLALRTCFRFIRRLEVIGELGSDGLRVPLGLNLVIVAKPARET